MAAPGEEVREWLTNDAKLERYFDNFMQSGLNTLSKCCTLDDRMLDLLGIELPGHRKRLVGVAKQLQERLEAEGVFTRPELPDKDENSPPPALPPKKKNSSLTLGGPEMTTSAPHCDMGSEKIEEQHAPPKVTPRMSSLQRASPGLSSSPVEQVRSTDCVTSGPSPFTDDPPPLPPKDVCPAQPPLASSLGITTDPSMTGAPPLPPKEIQTSPSVPETLVNRSADTSVSPPPTPTQTGSKPVPAPRQTSTKRLITPVPVPVPRPRPCSVVESASSKRGKPVDIVRHHSDENLLSQSSAMSDTSSPWPPSYQSQNPQEVPVNVPFPTQPQPFTDSLCLNEPPTAGQSVLKQQSAVDNSKPSQLVSPSLMHPGFPVPEQPYAMLGQILHGIGPPPRDKSLSPPSVPGVSMNQSNPPPYQSNQNFTQPAAGSAANSNLYWVVSDIKPVALQPGMTLPEGNGIYELAGAPPSDTKPVALQPGIPLPEESGIYELAGAIRSNTKPTALQPSMTLPEGNGIYELAGAPPSSLPTRQLPQSSTISSKQTPINPNSRHPYSQPLQMQQEENEYSLIGEVGPGPGPGPGPGLVNRLPQPPRSGNEYIEFGQVRPGAELVNRPSQLPSSGAIPSSKSEQQSTTSVSYCNNVSVCVMVLLYCMACNVWNQCILVYGLLRGMLSLYY